MDFHEMHISPYQNPSQETTGWCAPNSSPHPSIQTVEADQGNYKKKGAGFLSLYTSCLLLNH